MSLFFKKIDQVDPEQYGKTRNYNNGAVTYLSPYLSRGVLSTKQMLDRELKKGCQMQQIQSFMKELFLPVAPNPKIDIELPTFVYNYYNLDP